MEGARVDDLFRWYKSVTIGGRQVWLRTLSATDESERMKACMRAARKLRSKLTLDGTPEREELLSAYGGIGREELLVAMRMFREIEARKKVADEIHPEIDPPEPKEDTLDSAIEAEEAWEAELEKVAERRRAWVKEHVDVIMQKEHEGQDIEDLRKEVVENQISVFCNQAFSDEFERQSVFRACYEDEELTKRTFNSADEAGALSGRVFNYLVREYYDLDKFGLDSELLKN